MTSSKNIRPHYHHGDSQKLDNPRLTSTPQVRAVALPVGKSIKKFTCPLKIPLLTIFLRIDAIQYVIKSSSISVKYHLS